MIGNRVPRRRWRPRWLTPRAVILGSVFTLTIFAFALAVAGPFAAPTRAAPAVVPPAAHVASPAARHESDPGDGTDGGD